MWWDVVSPFWKEGFSLELTSRGEVRVEPELFVGRNQLLYLRENDAKIRSVLRYLSIRTLAARYETLRRRGGVLEPVLVGWQLNDALDVYQQIRLESREELATELIREALGREVLLPEGMPVTTFRGYFPHDWGALAQTPRLQLHLIRLLVRAQLNSLKARALLSEEIRIELTRCV